MKYSTTTFAYLNVFMVSITKVHIYIYIYRERERESTTKMLNTRITNFTWVKIQALQVG